MRQFFVRAANLFRRNRAEREMAREIESHLVLLQEEFESRGLSAEDAARAARRAYGGVEQSRELHREARTFLWLEQLLRDVSYGWRNLVRNPGFTFTAVTALALGIGANATIFALYNAIALKPLPVADAARVVRVKRWFAHNTTGERQYNFAWPEYRYLQDHNDVFSGMVATTDSISVFAALPGQTAQEHLEGRAVSANYFAELGVKAFPGRTFSPDENRVIVLGYRFWQRRLRGDAKVIGSTMALNGLPYTIIGVAPKEFPGTDLFPTESGFWAPLGAIDQLEPSFGAGWRDEWRDATHPGFQLLARLKPGVMRAQAQANAQVLMRQYLAGHREPERTTAVTLQRTSWLAEPADMPFANGPLPLMVSVVVALVLLVACANVANMLLARGAGRRREIGIRLALGASRGRVIRQLLTESILLSLLGGAAAIPLATWGGRLMWASLTGALQGFFDLLGFGFLEPDLTPDAHMLFYGLALAVCTGILFGLAPALRFTRFSLSAAIKPDHSRLRALLLAAQVAISVPLLMFSVSFLPDVLNAHANNPGFEIANVYIVFTDVNDAAQANAINRRLRTRLATLPQLTGVAMGNVPLMDTTLEAPMAVGKLNRQINLSYESDGYFETMGIRILRGRSFTRQEAARGAPVTIISQATAGHFWPGQDALGKHFLLDPTSHNRFTDFEVVGIAKDVHYADLFEADVVRVYLPTGMQAGETTRFSLLFRVRGDRGKALTAVRSAIESVDRSLLPGLNLVSMEKGPVAMQRKLSDLMASFSGSLALLALTLSGIGIYGVIAFLVSQQTREIGIRMALGASSRGIAKDILIAGLKPVFAGMAAGIAIGMVMVVWHRSTEPFPQTMVQSLFGDAEFVGSLAIMLAVGVLACVIPARRALRVEPVLALRHE